MPPSPACRGLYGAFVSTFDCPASLNASMRAACTGLLHSVNVAIPLVVAANLTDAALAHASQFGQQRQGQFDPKQLLASSTSMQPVQRQARYAEHPTGVGLTQLAFLSSLALVLLAAGVTGARGMLLSRSKATPVKLGYRASN